MLRIWVDEYEEPGVSSFKHEIMFNYVHLVDIRKSFGSMSKEKRRKSKTGEVSMLEHVAVLIFLVLMRIDLHFSDVFPRN